MKYEILEQGTYPLLEVTLTPGEKIVAESGAMTWMSPDIKVKTGTRGGILSGLKRSVLGGESLFQNEFYTEGGQGLVGLVPGQPGTIVPIQMDSAIYMERGAYLASDPTVTLDSKFAGLKGLFAEGLFILKAGGTGTLFFSGYGDVTEIMVEGEYIVDNGYAVAWDSSLEYAITRVKKARAFLFGDLLLMHFKGHGRLWVQSRSPYPLASWFYPFRPQKKGN